MIKNLPSDIFVLKTTAEPIYSTSNYTETSSWNALTTKTGDLYLYMSPTLASANTASVNVIIERSHDRLNWVTVTSQSYTLTTSTVLFINDIGPFTPWLRAKYRFNVITSSVSPSSATGDYLNMVISIVGYDN